MRRDLFKPVVPEQQVNPYFREILTPRYAAARRLMNEIFGDFHDVDHNFIREFQTGGFSPRVFELALFAYLREHNLDLDRGHPAPDFVTRGQTPVAIEVTTTNPAQGSTLGVSTLQSLKALDLQHAEETFTFQLGKALKNKLEYLSSGSHYWDLPHVAGMPFVIAVGAFHHKHAQIHGMGLVAEYLYGVHDEAQYDRHGKLTIKPQPIVSHKLAGKRPIPSGLFRQPAAANLAGVLFSNAHTIMKFNRIGIERGYGTPEVTLRRVGTSFDPNPNAAVPRQFDYVVGSRPVDEHETFAESLQLFVNPWATDQISLEALPGIVVHEPLKNGLLKSSYDPGLHPLSSITAIEHIMDDPESLTPP